VSAHLRLLAYAKLNLTLDILCRRDDGYHDLRSIMQAIALHDVVDVVLGGDGVRVECDAPDVPSGPRNSAFRAAEAALDVAGVATGVHVRLEKRIPSGAGLAGGSSDAAAVILALRHLLPDRLTDRAALDIAARVGADVPFFLTGGTAVVSGIGEQVQPLPRRAPLHFALLKPDFGIDTRWAYDVYDRSGEPQPPQLVGAASAATPPPDRMVAALRDAGAAEVAAHLGNAFWPSISAARPELTALHDELLATGALGAAMTGSGSCLYGVFADGAQALRAAQALAGPGRFTEAARAVDCGAALDTPEGPQPLRLGEVIVGT
jgi:4-diphosphocytidyl-2-C-methyl-D-erythritol kinase